MKANRITQNMSILILIFFSLTCTFKKSHFSENEKISISVVRNTKACDKCARFDIIKAFDEKYSSLLGKSIYIYLDSLDNKEKLLFDSLIFRKDEHQQFIPLKINALISPDKRKEDPFSPNKTIGIYVLNISD